MRPIIDIPLPENAQGEVICCHFALLRHEASGIHDVTQLRLEGLDGFVGKDVGKVFLLVLCLWDEDHLGDLIHPFLFLLVTDDLDGHAACDLHISSITCKMSFSFADIAVTPVTAGSRMPPGKESFTLPLPPRCRGC